MTTRGALIRGVLIVSTAGVTTAGGAFQSWSATWSTKDWILAFLAVVGAMLVAARAYYDQSMGDAKKDAEDAAEAKEAKRNPTTQRPNDPKPTTDVEDKP